MALLARRRPPQALTASAADATNGHKTRAFFGRGRQALTASAARGSDSRSGLQRLDQQWQRQAMEYYRTIGEAWYPAQFYTRAMKRIRFFPAILDDRGDRQEVESGELVDLFRQIRDPGGGINQIAATYGQLHFTIGDGYLIVSEEDGEDLWEYVSPMELRRQPGTGPDGRVEYRRIRAPGIMPEELVEAPDNDFEPLTGDSVRVWRLYRRHPEFSSWSDSPIRPILELYEVLARLTLATGARASSRAAQQGALYVPEELSFSPADKTMDEDPKSDTFMADLIASYVRAIQNPGDAEAMMPFIIRGPGVHQTAGGSVPMKDLIGIIDLNGSDGYPEAEAWNQVIDRIAGDLDMPREMVAPSGLGNTNHWSGWLLEETGFRSHIAPTVLDFCDDVASAYLRPAAIDAGLEDADRVTMGFDPSQAILHPDQVGNAFKAHDMLLVSNAYARKVMGATEDDAPDEEEYAERVEIKLKQLPPEIAAEAGGQTDPAGGGTGGDVTQRPPAEPGVEPPPDAPPTPRGPTTASAALITGAALMQIDRARERAGNQLRRRSQSCETCQQQIRGVPPHLVAATLGAETVRGVLDGHGSEAELLGTCDLFADRLRKLGVRGEWPERLAALVEQHALRTLYEAEVPPLPPGFAASCERAVA